MSGISHSRRLFAAAGNAMPAANPATSIHWPCRPIQPRAASTFQASLSETTSPRDMTTRRFFSRPASTPMSCSGFPSRTMRSAR